MKTLFYINASFISILLLSACFHPYMFIIGLIPLGILQLLSALYLFSIRNALNTKNKKLLAYYFGAIFSWVIVLVLITKLPDNFQQFVNFLGLFPIAIAVYFIYLLYKIKESI